MSYTLCHNKSFSKLDDGMTVDLPFGCYTAINVCDVGGGTKGKASH